MNRRARNSFAAVVAALALTFAACGGEEESGGRTTLTWFIAQQPGGALAKIADTCSKQSNGRYKISLELLPKEADQQREQLVRRLGAEDQTMDLLGMDVVWTGEFANAGWLKPIPPDVAKTVSANVFDSVLETARAKNRLQVMPLWSNTELLWYRKDRVPNPPKTWDEMIDQAEKLGPAKGRIQLQANRYEGLVVWANQLIESAGTSVLSGPTTVKLDKAPTERALKIMGRLSNSKIAPVGLTTLDEGASDQAFQGQGGESDSAFMINYPFVYPSAKGNKDAKAIFEQMRAAKYPAVDADKPSAPPIGGINIGVSKFSKHPGEAFAASQCLVKAENQLQVAALEGLPPVRSDLYDRPEIKKVYPGFADIIKTSIEDAAPRPSISPAYQDLSLAIQRALHPTTKLDPANVDSTYDDLRDKIDKAIKREGLL